MDEQLYNSPGQQWREENPYGDTVEEPTPWTRVKPRFLPKIGTQAAEARAALAIEFWTDAARPMHNDREGAVPPKRKLPPAPLNTVKNPSTYLAQQFCQPWVDWEIAWRKVDDRKYGTKSAKIWQAFNAKLRAWAKANYPEFCPKDA